MKFLWTVICIIFNLTIFLTLMLLTYVISIVIVIIYMLARITPHPLNDKLYKVLEYICDHGDLLKKIFEPPPSK
jgi:hypothetical protein